MEHRPYFYGHWTRYRLLSSVLHHVQDEDVHGIQQCYLRGPAYLEVNGNNIYFWRQQ